MCRRLAVTSIIVEDKNAVGKLNEILHEYADFIIGRMGIPYKAMHVNLVSVAIDAPQDVISAMSGKLGGIKGLSVKTALSNVSVDEQ